ATLSDHKITHALLAALHDTLTHPDVIRHFLDQAQRRIAAIDKKGGSQDDELERRIRDCERRIANFTEALGKMGWSEAVAAKLKEEETTLARLKAEHTRAAKPAGARSLPQPAVIADDYKELEGVLRGDPVEGRKVLSRLVSPLHMFPEGE